MPQVINLSVLLRTQLEIENVTRDDLERPDEWVKVDHRFGVFVPHYDYRS